MLIIKASIISTKALRATWPWPRAGAAPSPHLPKQFGIALVTALTLRAVLHLLCVGAFSLLLGFLGFRALGNQIWGHSSLNDGL